MSLYPFVETIYLLFAYISLYFSLLFFILFFKNRYELKKSPVLKKLPFISIIIPAYNEEKTIGKTIEALGQIKYPKKLLEIIVVDDGSTDKTYQVASEFKGIKVFRKKNGGKGSALNFGVKRARGE